MSRILVSWLLFAVSLIALAFVAIGYLTADELYNNKVLMAVFLLLVPVLVTDRVAGIFTEMAAAKEAQALESRLKSLPGNLAGRNDIITFPNANHGTEYCAEMARRATLVKNTVLRYGEGATSMPLPDQMDGYQRWLAAKRESVSSGCTWVEIVSQYLAPKDPQSEFVVVMTARNNYKVRWIDDKNGVPVQMILMEFPEGGKEVLFGWQLPTMPQGPCFLTRNQKVIEYFESYFSCLVERSQPNRAVAKAE
jgi:hypothetical protein